MARVRSFLLGMVLGVRDVLVGLAVLWFLIVFPCYLVGAVLMRFDAPPLTPFGPIVDRVFLGFVLLGVGGSMIVVAAAIGSGVVDMLVKRGRL